MRLNNWELTLILVGLLATACGQASTDPTITTASQRLAVSSGETAQCEPGKEHWRSSGAPIRGGSLSQVAYIRSGVPHLDASAVLGAKVGEDVYQALMTARGCYYEDLVMAPSLAKSWETSTDGRTWTFKLRDDIKWHNKPPVNGRRFTSADVAWTIEMQKQGGLLRTLWEGISHQEPDPYTVVLQLQEPDADFLVNFQRYNFIFAREVKEQYGDFKTVAIGTGPWMLKEFNASVAKVLERNPDWPDKGADGRPLPYLDEVRTFYVVDTAATLAAAYSKQADFFGGLDVTGEMTDALLGAMPKQFVHYPSAAGSLWGIFFNLQKPPFDDVKLRKALALAIDSEELLAGPRRGARRSGFIPVAVQPWAWTSEKAKEKFPHDPVRAKQLLAEAGYDPPSRLQLVVETQPAYEEETEVIVAQLKRLGIDTVQKTHPPGSGNTATVLTRPEFSGILWGALSYVVNVPGFWFGAPLRTGSSYNFYRLSDPKVDALSIAQGRELDPVKRKQIFDEMHAYLFEIMYIVPSYSRIYNMFYSCRIKNAAPPHFTGDDKFSEAWLDQSGC